MVLESLRKGSPLCSGYFSEYGRNIVTRGLEIQRVNLLRHPLEASDKLDQNNPLTRIL